MVLNLSLGLMVFEKGILTPFGCGAKTSPDINSCVGMERSCPRDSKNVSYVDVGLVQTCLDLIESYGWGGGVGGLSKNLVKPWA